MSTARAENGVIESISAEVKSVFDHAREAVCKIEAIDDSGRLAGTGFFIDPNGTLFTSYTVGGESHDIIVCRGAAKYPATRLIGDSRSGIAILKIEAPTPFLPLGDVKTADIATPVVAIGYPMDLPLTPNFGLIAGFDLKYLGRFFSTAHIRANVPVQRGEGGAPLLNLKGEVIGILISSLDSGSGCFALPINAAEKVRSDYMRFGDVRPGWLGISLTTDPSGGTSSARITDLVEDSPASKAGFKKGDILLSIGDIPIHAPEDVLNAAFYLTAGDEVSITVERGAEKVTVKVQPTNQPLLKDPLHELAPLTPGPSLQNADRSDTLKAE